MKTVVAVMLFFAMLPLFAEEMEAIPMYSSLSPAQATHRLFQPNDQDVPHPFYQEECDSLPPPKPYPRARGSATLLYNRNTDELHYAIAYSGLSGQPIMLHFHLGSVGIGGPIIQTIAGKPSGCIENLGCSESPPLSGENPPKGTSGFITGIYKLKGNPHLDPPLSLREERRRLLNGDIYINIHTCLNELGEMRGQIYPQAVPP